MDKKRKIIAILKFFLLLVFIFGIPVYIYFYNDELTGNFSTLEDVKTFLLQYEIASSLVYLAFQVLHIIAGIIPGQPFHLAAGFIFDFWLGYTLSIIGITFGTTATFYLSRILGKDAMYLFLGEKRFTKFLEMMNRKKALVVIFIIYLIPGLPKEIVGYAVGLSKIKVLPFILIMIVGRTPALMASILIGSMYADGGYTGVVILSIIVVMLCIIAFIYRKKIMQAFQAV